jgi:hypothetical protein
MPVAIDCHPYQVLIHNFLDNEAAEQQGPLLIPRHLQTVLIRMTVNEGHLFHSKSLIRMVAGVKRANPKKLINLIVKRVNKLIKHLEDHEDDSFEYAQVDYARLVTCIVGYFYPWVLLLLLRFFFARFLLGFVFVVDHADLFVERDLFELFDQ